MIHHHAGPPTEQEDTMTPVTYYAIARSANGVDLLEITTGPKGSRVLVDTFRTIKDARDAMNKANEALHSYRTERMPDGWVVCIPA
jgi:hypothetical protein